MFSLLLALIAWVAPPAVEASLACEPLYEVEPLRLPGPDVAVPFVPHSGQVVVEVLVDGRGPYRFTVDTGAAVEACVDQHLARELSLPVVGRVRNGDGSGHVVERDLARIGSLQLGERVFHDLDAIVADYAWVGGFEDPDIHGILGFPLFAEWLLTLDYPAGELRLTRGELPVSGPNHVIDFRHVDGQPHVDLEIAGQGVTTLIDTGFAGGLHLPRELLTCVETVDVPRRAGRLVSVNSSNIRRWAATLRSPVELAGWRYERPAVGFVEVHTEGTLGRAMLAQHAVTFDQCNGRMYLGPSTIR